MGQGRTRSDRDLRLAAIVFFGNVLLASAANDGCTSTQPNILMFMADDYGYADISFNNRFMPTPNLERMAREGMILNKLYTHATCSPSRGALMTGKYSHHIGLGHYTITNNEPFRLDENHTLLPQALKDLGYATYMQGKWHMGFCNLRFTPTYRGFDVFDGFYSAAGDYYNHEQKGGYDFRHNTVVDRTVIGNYSTHVFAERAVDLINNHNCSKPFYMYLAFQAVHGPLEVPQSYVDRYCSHIREGERKLKCGMIAALDEAVANVTNAIRQRGLLNNTFIVFQSDNGGAVPEAASNWPLRGTKSTLWEGGTRVPAFVYAPAMLKKTNITYNGIVHISDWYATFVEAAGGAPRQGLDGISQWNNLRSGGASPRKGFIYSLDEVTKVGGIRHENFKLVQGWPGEPSGWYVSPELKEAGWGETNDPGKDYPAPDYYLFDLDVDPSERNNLMAGGAHQDVFNKLKRLLDKEWKTVVPAGQYSRMKEADPKNFGGVWSPGWC